MAALKMSRLSHDILHVLLRFHLGLLDGKAGQHGPGAADAGSVQQGMERTNGEDVAEYMHQNCRHLGFLGFTRLFCRHDLEQQDAVCNVQKCRGLLQYQALLHLSLQLQQHPTSVSTYPRQELHVSKTRTAWFECAGAQESIAAISCGVSLLNVLPDISPLEV